jgi:hypothetical protein
MKAAKASVRLAGLLAEIGTPDLLNTKEEC